MRPFFDTIREIRGGECLNDLAAQLSIAVQAVEDTNKPATLVFTIKLKPFGKKLKEPAFELIDEIKLTLPAEDKSSTIFFPAEGDLWRRQPRQQEIMGVGLALMPEPKSGAA